MSNRSTHPVEIGPTSDGERLRIKWGDGHVSVFSPLYLRLNCRCAACVDEMTGEPILEPGRVPGDVHPYAIQYVGRYALSFDWSDGHSSGIYPFELLRTLCPCEGCASPVH